MTEGLQTANTSNSPDATSRVTTALCCILCIASMCSRSLHRTPPASTHRGGAAGDMDLSRCPAPPGGRQSRGSGRIPIRPRSPHRWPERLSMTHSYRGTGPVSDLARGDCPCAHGAIQAKPRRSPPRQCASHAPAEAGKLWCFRCRHGLISGRDWRRVSPVPCRPVRTGRAPSPPFPTSQRPFARALYTLRRQVSPRGAHARRALRPRN